MKTSVVKHYFIEEEKIKDTYLANQLKINHSFVLGNNNINGYFKNADEALKDAYRKNQRFIILHWQSSYFDLTNLGKILVEYENMFDYEHGIFGSIVDSNAKNKAGWFGFLPMTVAVDLEVLNFKNEEEIKFGDIQEFPATVSKIIRSTDNVYSNYTPTWIKKDEGEEVITRFLKPGWALINYAISKNLEILNLNGNTKKLKTHLYGTDHSDDFCMMSDVFEKVGILENSTMADWFLKMLTNLQNSSTNIDILHEEFFRDSEINDTTSIAVVNPVLKDIEKISLKANKIYILTENVEEFAKIRFLFNDQKILNKYGYNIDITKCQIIMEDIFKNKLKFVKFCKEKNVDSLYIRGLVCKRNNVGLTTAIDFIQNKLKHLMIIS